MSYSIQLTNKSTLTAVADGQIDTISTDLALFGKSATGYGVYLNDNFVHLLENFANTTRPPHAIKGQLWYDTSVNILKVYNGNDFVVTNGTFVSSTVPSSLTTGGLWINNETGQMYFNDGTQTILAGPLYTKTQGASGFVTQDVMDVYQIQHTIVLLYVAQVLIGIFSKDAFTPFDEIAGFTGSISVGFNAASYNGIIFNVTASQAAGLVAADGSISTAESFLSSSEDSSTTGSLSIQNEIPLILGSTSSSEINVTDQLFTIKSNSLNQNIEISSLNGNGQMSAIFVDAENERVGIFTDTPQATLDINGGVTINGDLVVTGTTTSTNTSTIDLENLTITMADTPNPTDNTANNAGLIVKGTTDHTWLWSNTTGWTSSEDINITTGNVYSIGGSPVLTHDSLGSSIVNIPGTLNSITVVGSVLLNSLSVVGNQLTYVNPSNVNGDVVITPKGAGSVNMSSAKVINVATPAALTDAANKGYVDTVGKSIPLAIGLITTGFTNAQIASVFLSRIFPAAEHVDASICRVSCTDTNITGGISAGPGSSPSNPFDAGTVYQIVSVGTTDFTEIGAANNTVGTVFIATGNGSGTGIANPVIRVFQLLSGSWTYESNL